ncbi:acyl-CoA reductase [Arenibacter certesii]|uniref:Acyl-CoA reductase n=1 Tax=Arenibacter certesii TaxID=228955 RepID=A0A918MHV9_9FLAO|nr:acyl-CoA reductase [Arenibacter certesii]GGW25837.1 acyl-CoA reductase [Arenibacter certesii]
MTKHSIRLNALVKLGIFFKEYYEYAKNNPQLDLNSNPWFKAFDETITLAGHKNGWFTPDNILFSIKTWGELLEHTELNNWLSPYDPGNNSAKSVAVIMAGNIPLVGFHDFLSTLITGNNIIMKLSSNDKILLPFICSYLIEVEPSLKDAIEFADGKLENFDAVIATGSDNTSRYFEHYFGKKPNIIRRNRNSVAVLTGRETEAQLQALGEDIFRYYGLGCRSVSKIFVPKDYNFDLFFKAIYPYNNIVEHAKYANNYDYNKAVYLMSLFPILENGFLMLKEDTSYASPIATLFYEKYNSLAELKVTLENDTDKLQCIVADGFTTDEIPFGQTQRPSLTDYADNMDTVEFLLKL